jgi:hypothetical protein
MVDNTNIGPTPEALARTRSTPMRKIYSAFILVAAMAATAVVHATPITGQFSINGSVTPGTNVLTFDPVTIESSVNTQTGDFVTILGETHVPAIGGTTTLNYNPYPGGAFFEFPNLTMDILTVNEQTVLFFGVPFEFFTANVVFISPGFQDTSGTFAFSTQAGGEVSFSATGISSGIPSRTPPVPEPSSIALLGTAAFVGAGFMKKRIFS